MTESTFDDDYLYTNRDSVLEAIEDCRFHSSFLGEIMEPVILDLRMLDTHPGRDNCTSAQLLFVVMACTFLTSLCDTLGLEADGDGNVTAIILRTLVVDISYGLALDDGDTKHFRLTWSTVMDSEWEEELRPLVDEFRANLTKSVACVLGPAR